MVTILSSKNEEDPIKIKAARVATIQNIVVILVTCKNEEDPLKNKDARVATTQNIYFSNIQGQITPQSEVGSGRNSNSSEIL